MMKALYKKYSSLARKYQRAFAQLQSSGYFSRPDVGPMTEKQLTAFAAAQTSYAEDKSICRHSGQMDIGKNRLGFLRISQLHPPHQSIRD